MMRVARERRRSMACNNCLRSLLKLANFLLAFAGLAILLYSVWNLCKLSDSFNLQHRALPSVSSNQWQLADNWFPYCLLGLGVVVCLVTLVGHIAAETSNECCLSSYVFFLILLGMLQGFFVAEVLLNKDWKRLIPEDSTGVFDDIENFVEDNLSFCKWVGLAIVIIEFLALTLALCTRAATPDDWASYDSDDEYILPRTSLRAPLLIPRHAADCSSTANTGTVEGWPVSRR